MTGNRLLNVYCVLSLQTKSVHIVHDKVEDNPDSQNNHYVRAVVDYGKRSRYFFALKNVDFGAAIILPPFLY